jgi:hypothetical protein
MGNTNTQHHSINRTTENVGPFGLFDSTNKTTITDKDTGAHGTGLGRSRSEADERAWDSIRSANEARKK